MPPVLRQDVVLRSTVIWQISPVAVFCIKTPSWAASIGCRHTRRHLSVCDAARLHHKEKHQFYEAFTTHSLSFTTNSFATESTKSAAAEDFLFTLLVQFGLHSADPAANRIAKMLEYFTYKKIKKHRDAKENARQDLSGNTASTPSSDGTGGPVLTDDDELFFERLTSENGYADEAGMRPPLPPRVKTPDYTWDSDENSSTTAPATNNNNNSGSNKTEISKTKTGEKDTNPAKRGFSFLVRHNPITAKKDNNRSSSLKPTNLAVPLAEEEREKNDLSRVLDDLDLSARNNKTFSLSKDSQELVSKFTVVLKDLVNGVPTAATDLRHLFEDHDGTLARNYEKLPSSMKKLVTNLPTKLTGSLAPELLAVAAESQGLKHDKSAKGGIKEQAMNLVMPKNLADLVTKPSAIVGMLKAIMNALKTRWPAFIGTNVIWSVALFCKSSLLPMSFVPKPMWRST